MWINDTFRCSLIILSALLGLVAIHKFVAADAPDPYLGRAVKRCQNSSDMRFMTIGIVGTRDRNDPYNTLLERAELMLLRDRFGTVYHLTEFDYGSNGTGVAQTACYVLMFVEFRVVPEKRSSYFSETDLLWYERNQVDRVDFLVGSYVASAASISALKNIPYFVITPVDDLQTEHLRLTGQIAGPIVNMQPFREQTWLTTADLLRFLQSERVLLLHDIHYIVDVERVKTLILLEPGWLVENIYPLMIRGTKLAYYQGEVGYTIGADPDSIDDIVYLLRSRDIDTVVFFFHRTYRWAMITDLADKVDQTGVKSYKWICGTLEGPSDEGTVAFPPSQTLLKLNDLYIDVPSSFKKNTNKTKDDPGSSRPGRVTADTEVDMYLLQFSHLMRRVLSGMRTGFDGSRFHASVLSNKYNASRLLFPTCNHYLDPIRLTFDSRGIRKQPKIAIAKVFASETKVNTYWQNTTLWEHRFVVDTGCPVYSPLFHFKIVPLIEAPYLTVIEDPLEVLQGNDRFDGLLIDLLRTIEEYLLSDYDIRLNVDIDSSSIETTGGGKVANGTGWTGAIGRLVRSGDYLPMILGALTKTLDRMQVVQFTPGFIFDGITVIYRPVRKENSFYSFLKPFDYGAWIVVLAAILLSLVHLRFLYFWDPMKDAQADTERNFRLKAVSWYSFGTTFQSGAPYEPISTPMRIYAVTLMFFASVVIGCYTGNMARFLTEVAFEEPVEKLTDFADQEEYSYGVVAGSSVESFFVNSVDPVYSKMGERMRERKHLVKSIDEGISLVMNSTEDEPFALIERSQALRAHRAKMGLCHLHIMKAQVSVQEIGIAYGKSFALHEPFTRVLNKIISSGEMNDILNYWTVAKDPCLTVPSSGKPQQISYLHFSGPLVMIAASIPLSMIFIGVKLFHYKRCGLDKRYTGATETSPAVRPVGCIG